LFLYKLTSLLVCYRQRKIQFGSPWSRWKITSVY